MWFTSPFKLAKQGVLGMNSRNVDYISRYNPRSSFPIVDNKLLTKQAAQAAGIPVPELLATITSQWQLRDLPELLRPMDRFVIKPTRGSGGKGILVISESTPTTFVKTSGKTLSFVDVRRHINNTLSGLYSLGGKPDHVMIEAMVNDNPVLGDYTYQGVPDIRIIVFQGFPIMAMLRCATQDSDGRANLHQGAIGVGLSLSTGGSQRAVRHNTLVNHHPDTNKSFADLHIPHWQQILEIAASSYEMTGLGYVGCDMILDRERGPMLLELNARPGLAIQMASANGLKRRLQIIERLDREQREIPAAERVKHSQQLFD